MSFVSMQRPVRSAETALLDVAIEPHFDFGSEEYQSIQQRSQTTAFQGSRWLEVLYRDVAPAMAAEPLTVTVREKADGRLVLVLPLALYRRYGVHFVEFADFGLCDYIGAIYDPTDVPLLVADDTLPQRIGACLPPCDIISLMKLTGDDPVLERLFPNARRARMRVSAYPAKIDTDWADWRLENLDGSLRRELDMKRRRLAKKGTPAFVLVKDDSEINRVFEALRSFRAERFKERGDCDVISKDAVFLFYRQIAVDGARTGTARTFCLYLSGEPIAVMFGLVHRRTFSLLLVGFDLARYRRLSPGLLAIEDTLRASIEAGDAIYDFTIGDHPYKLQFGAESVPLYEWHTARTIRGYLAILSIEIVRETKRVLKRLVRGEMRLPSDTPTAKDR
jgi:CelD/BcsL family acetyltransferase involved in cellulose biosynthesis